jgi:hypothetical protein
LELILDFLESAEGKRVHYAAHYENEKGDP